MYYMKTITTRLPDELAEMLDTVSNKSDFIRTAIEAAFNKNEPDDSKFVTKQQVVELIKQTINVKQKESTGTVTLGDPVDYPKFKLVRSRNDITTEIAQLEAERDEMLEFSQDQLINKKIALDYKSQIDAVWAEFHSIGKESLNV